MCMYGYALEGVFKRISITSENNVISKLQDKTIMQTKMYLQKNAIKAEKCFHNVREFQNR